MKKLLITAALLCTIVFTSLSFASSIIEGFETGSKAAYAAADIVLSTGTWNMSDALIGNLANDKRIGNWSARVRSLGTIRMQFDLTTGASTVLISHARYGTDAANTWELWYSTNSGGSWTQAGTSISPATTLATETFTINIQGTIRFEIRKTSVNSTTNRINFDDITINSYDYGSSTGGITVSGGLGGSNDFVPAFPQDPATGNQPPIYVHFSGTGTPIAVNLSYSATALVEPFAPSGTIDRFFTITQVGGTNWTTTLSLFFVAAEDVNNLRFGPIDVMRSIDGGISWLPFATNLLAFDMGGGAYRIDVPNVTEFSMWALGNDGILPVELTSFIGDATENGIELRWRTESETENDYFTVDRWIEGDESTITSVTVSSLAHNGSSSTPLNYVYRDTRNLIPGAVYNYRLSDVSLSGERRLLRIITVNNTASSITVPKGFGLVEAYPNPFNSMATIKVQLREAGSAKVAVYNLEGKLVTELYSGALGISPKLISWDASQMATGMYIVKLTSNRFSTEKKLVLMR